ncbi:MAG: YraN family protein [Candidatus Pacebacteria bacterium]|nr:YraN family protein [Candidatus Paceibacterota bacterium]
MAKSEKRKIGDIGENIACRFLEKRGFKIIDRNYLKKWGEIDIVARKKQGLKDKILKRPTDNKIYFVEVKTVSCENIRGGITAKMRNYQVDNNVHPWKLQRLARVFQTYLLDKRISDETEWRFDIIIAFLDIKDKISRIKYLKDIII